MGWTIGAGKNLRRLRETIYEDNFERLHGCGAGGDCFGRSAEERQFSAKAKPSVRRPTPDRLPLRRAEVVGALPRGIRGGNPLQMLNPKAPAKYGNWVQSTSFDPDVPGKWKGIKLFEWVF